MAVQEDWIARLTRSMIQDLCPAHVYKKGQSYYTSGRVRYVRLVEDTLHAVVTGRSDYTVAVRGDRTLGVNAGCTCPYSEYYYGACKHIVAAMIHLIENLEEILSDNETRVSTVKHMVTLVPPEKAVEFLTDVMIMDESVRQRFVDTFGLGHVRPVTNYKSSMDRLYSGAKGSDGKISHPLNFDRYFDNARASQSGGEFADAAKIYQTISEKISENMGAVDDSGRYYTDCFMEALDGMAESIIRNEMPAGKKHEHVSYLFEKLMEGRPVRFVPYYRSALETVCTTDEDTVFLHDTIDSHLHADGPVPDGTMAEMVHMQADALERLTRTAELVSLLEEFYYLDSRLCVRYLGMLHNDDDDDDDAAAAAAADPDQVLQAIHDATDAFPDNLGVMEAVLELYPETAPGYVSTLREMFVATGDWKYFFRIRGASCDWHADVEAVVMRFREKPDPGMAVNAYLKGSMADEAMNLLESIDDADLFAAYRTKLAPAYPGRYFAAYGTLIRRFAKSTTGRDHYARVCRHLASIKAIPGGDRSYGELILNIRRENSGRRVLLELIRGM